MPKVLSKPNRPLHILFSIYAWIAAIIFLPVYFLVFTLSLFILGYDKGYTFIRFFYLFYYLLWSPIKVNYHPDFDPQKPYVLTQNHINVLDGFLTGRISPNPICGLMHAWQFKIPLYGWIMQMSRGISVYPQNKDNLTRMTQEARIRKHEGLSILTFPEGGRTLDGNLKPFKKGVFVMARDAGYDVAPVVVMGNFEINQKGSKMFWPHPITVEVMQPKSLEGLNRETLGPWVENLQQEMQNVLNDFKSES